MQRVHQMNGDSQVIPQPCSPLDAFSLALLRHLGIDADRVTKVTYEHQIRDIPTVTVECLVWDGDRQVPLLDDGFLTTTEHRYEWRRVQ